MGEYVLYNGDSTELFDKITSELSDENIIIVSDPPFNIGYKYDTYEDKMSEEDYYDMMNYFFGELPCAIIHYPEEQYKISRRINKIPDEIISWVYPSNMNRQHRDIVMYGVKPDFRKVRQPYREDSAKTRRLLAKGTGGAKIYDWWEINQVKNTSKEKTEHPCQMPIEVMERLIGILPDDAVIIDPFMGSGTTGVAVLNMNRKQNALRKFIGIEMDAKYYNIAKERIKNAEYCNM